MNKTIVVDYDENILKSLKDERLIVKIDSFDNIEEKYSLALHGNEVMAMVVTLPYMPISQIEFREEWERIPIILYAYNIGDYDLFLSKTINIRHLNIRIFLSSIPDTAFTDLKILASMGVDCGLDFDSTEAIDDEKILDLASYNYMSPVPHATIEPFEYILRHLTDEAKNDFNDVYFNNALKFLHIRSLDDTKTLYDKMSDFSIKEDSYYRHFIDLDECSKCIAFKICNRQMFNKLHDCQNTMEEIYEYAEIRNDLNNNNRQFKTVCQL